jgi:hypothetical protein
MGVVIHVRFAENQDTILANAFLDFCDHRVRHKLGEIKPLDFSRKVERRGLNFRVLGADMARQWIRAGDIQL